MNIFKSPKGIYVKQNNSKNNSQKVKDLATEAAIKALKPLRQSPNNLKVKVSIKHSFNRNMIGNV